MNRPYGDRKPLQMQSRESLLDLVDLQTKPWGNAPKVRRQEPLKPHIHIPQPVRAKRRTADIGALLKALQHACLAVALLCLIYAGINYGWAGIFQAYQSWRFDRLLANIRAGSAANVPSRTIPRPAPPFVPPQPGDVIGRIEINRINLSVMVLEGDSDHVLGKGAGHVPHTGFPGMGGNVVLAAHRDTFFRPLREIQKGDEITITTPQGEHKYKVGLITKVDPDDVAVMAPTTRPTVTLITCYPFEFVGHAPKRFIVQGEEIGLPASPVPQPVAAAVPTPVAKSAEAVDAPAPVHHSKKSRRKHVRSPVADEEPSEAAPAATADPPSKALIDPPQGEESKEVKQINKPAASVTQEAPINQPAPATAQKPAPAAPAKRTRKILHKVRGWLGINH
jgi:sortase A